MASSFRWFLLVGAVLSFLQATLVFGVFQRWLIEPWLRLSETSVVKSRRSCAIVVSSVDGRC